MKKFYTQLEKKIGMKKVVYVLVDNKTAKVLEQIDEETRRWYLQEEYEMKRQNLDYNSVTTSLDKLLENGFDIIDEKQDVVEIVSEKLKNEKVRQAIEMLEPQQQDIVRKIFYEGKKQVEIAKELGVGNTAIRNRLAKIKAKLKKFIEF